MPGLGLGNDKKGAHPARFQHEFDLLNLEHAPDQLCILVAVAPTYAVLPHAHRLVRENTFDVQKT
jgi:hypothetical protein